MKITNRTLRPRRCAWLTLPVRIFYASISVGIHAPSGPLHDGTNEAVLLMLAQIWDSGEGVSKFVDQVKRKEDVIKLMRFGHQVYKNYDPHAWI